MSNIYIGQAPCCLCGFYDDNIPLTGRTFPAPDGRIYWENEPNTFCKGCGGELWAVHVPSQEESTHPLFNQALVYDLHSTHF